MMFYAIQAYSRSRNQTQRELAEDELRGRPVTDKQLATQMATAFAERLNTQQFLRAQDWEPRIELVNNTNVYRL